MRYNEQRMRDCTAPIGSDSCFRPVVRRGIQPVARQEEDRLESRTHSRPAVDTKVLRTRFQGSEELLRRVTELYLEEVPAQVQALRAAVAAGDVETIAAVNHSLVNTAGTIEAITLTEYARAMEVQARKGELHRPADQLAAIEHELARIETSLRGLLRGLDPS